MTRADMGFKGIWFTQVVIGLHMISWKPGSFSRDGDKWLEMAN